MGTQVLSPEQARQIAARKTTFSIIPYDTAVAALRECLTFDEIKHWDNYAAIAAAWGKVHKSDEAIRLAKAVRLHAARRMGELARAIARQKNPHLKNNGVMKVLKEQGVPVSPAITALKLATMTPKAFEKAAARGHAPSTVAANASHANPWLVFRARSQWHTFTGAANAEDPVEMARFARKYANNIRDVKKGAEVLRGWLTDFIRAL